MSPRKAAPPAERFWAKVDTSGECWLWTAYCDPAGYGRFAMSRSTGTGYAHRIAYELTIGPIPEGLELDHLCRNRGCVRPSHLEPVTTKVNSMRSTSPIAANALKTHCPQGHAYDEENTRRHNGRRDCRACSRERASTGPRS